jgi:hypothetical protein
MKPALTPKEWGLWLKPDAYGPDLGWVEHLLHCDKDAFHKIPAMLLHNQEFGFTREMVEAIRNVVGFIAATRPYMFGDDHGLSLEAADRIEALLPPD